MRIIFHEKKVALMNTDKTKGLSVRIILLGVTMAKEKEKGMEKG